MYTHTPSANAHDVGYFTGKFAAIKVRDADVRAHWLSLTLICTKFAITLRDYFFNRSD